MGNEQALKFKQGMMPSALGFKETRIEWPRSDVAGPGGSDCSSSADRRG